MPDTGTTRTRPVPDGARLEAIGVGVTVRGGREVLRGIDLTVAPGRLVAVAGGSGAGKTLLLETLAGVHRPGRGQVLHDGVAPGEARVASGFVPQDDIVHRGLPLRHALGYSARLRGAELGSVERVLEGLGLTARGDQAVGTLSGGERKRASIAVELLTRPRVLFLDEPTSGLDPGTAAGLMETLAGFAESGVTVVLSTHAPADLARCDEVVFLRPSGALAAAGAPRDVMARFGADSFEEVYGAVAAGTAIAPPPAAGLPRPRAAAQDATPAALPDASCGPPGAVRQWWLLTCRAAEILFRDRLSAAIVVGSPLMIVAMFALLFRPGVFDVARPSPAAAAMVLFWIAFGAFFFGLAYGLLQICAELPVVRRERRAVLRLVPYLASKVTLLLPVLALADALLLLVLRALDRLPDAGPDVYGSLFVSGALASTAGLALGLFTSAAVADPSRAALMLPLLCFPQVLFTGAFVPVPEMAAAGRWISVVMSNRWAFEALGAGADLPGLWAGGASPLGAGLLSSYGDSFGYPAWTRWVFLGVFTLVFLAAAAVVLHRRCPAPARPRRVSRSAGR